MDKTTIQFFKPVILLFIIVTVLVFILSGWLDAHKIDHFVLLGANCILFMLILITGFIQINASKNSNPHAFVRGITLSTFIKLMVIAASVMIYLIVSKQNKSVYAVGVAMFLYIVYTVVEVNEAMRLNRKKNEQG